MTSCEFGDAILVPFPFTDQTATKKRPAVVVSSAAYHRDRPDVILMAVTSQPASGSRVGEVVVARWREAGLLKPSVIKPLVATAERGLLIRKLGRLADEDLELLRGALRVVLGE
ncbi:MAG: type II toxin-antitoxin system PemK/MazF family toxin [Deltaproteobacteria bacterium]|nr:type II toxin-antitoxin system PemK/MazF family toxin [Deltaproteobacteria bacterium]